MYKLILVDDEYDTGDFLRGFIEEEKIGFQVEQVFCDGLHAWEYMQKNHVDCVITDIKMPLMTGVELAQKIHDAGYAAKVIFLSGYGELNYAIRGIQIGITDYLLKPIDFEKLVCTLKNTVSTLNRETAEQQRMQEAQHIARETFLRDICLGNLDIMRDSYRLSRLNFTIPIEQLAGTVAELQLVGKELDGSEAETRKILSGLFPELYIISKNNSNFFGIKLNAGGVKQENSKQTDEIRFLNEVNFARLSDLPAAYAHLMELCAEKDDATPEVRAVKKYIKEHYMEQFSREDVAAACFVSASYMGRVFKRETGITYIEYLTKVRMENAIIFMKENIPIDKIAGKVGYSSTRHFVRVFKDYTGLSPRDYRRQNF